jgi:hypothetical protein
MLSNEDIQNLIKVQEEIFATKKDLQDIKDNIFEFKSEILTGQDKVLTKLDTLLQEKDVKDEQDKRQKKILEIHNNALKRSKILTEEEVTQISQSSVF